MRKSKLRTGEKMHVVTIGHHVKLGDFASALTGHFYNHGEQFPCTLTKKRAGEILKTSLFFNGLKGEYSEGQFEASFDEGEKWNTMYNKAISWVKIKYPWYRD